METCDLTCRQQASQVGGIGILNALVYFDCTHDVQQSTQVLPFNASHDGFLPEVSSVSDSMSSSGQVYQVAALISDKALFQVSGGKASHINNLNIIRKDKPPQEDNATISCIVDRLHLFRSITDMIRGTILWATRKYQIKCGNFNVQVVIPHPIKYISNILQATPHPIKFPDISYI